MRARGRPRERAPARSWRPVRPAIGEPPAPYSGLQDARQAQGDSRARGHSKHAPSQTMKLGLVQAAAPVSRSRRAREQQPDAGPRARSTLVSLRARGGAIRPRNSKRGWPLGRRYAGVPGVVAHEAVAGARELEPDGRDQHEPDEQVGRRWSGSWKRIVSAFYFYQGSAARRRRIRCQRLCCRPCRRPSVGARPIAGGGAAVTVGLEASDLPMWTPG